MNKTIIFAILFSLTGLLAVGYPIFELPGEISPGFRARPMESNDLSPASNAIGDIEYNAANGDIWVSTGNGLSVSTDNGETWETKLQGKGFSALAVLGDWIWAAASYDAEDPTDPNNSLPAGDAFYVSFDGGENFEHYREEEAEGIGKLAYDLAILPFEGDTIVYAACFYGGLICTENAGTSWTNIFPDGEEELDYSELAHRFFAVGVDTSAGQALVWAGSAKGLFMGNNDVFAWDKFDTAGHWIPDSVPIYDTTIVVDSVDTTYEVDSSDFYISWIEDSLSEGSISGNWIISIDFRYTGTTGMFACTRYTSENNTGPDYNAISFTENYGEKWDITGEGYIAWNMGFTTDTLWTACTHGLSRFPPDSTYSTAETLAIAGTDVLTGLPIEVLIDEVVSVTDCNGRLMAGTYSEGLAYSDDRGDEWFLISNFPDPSLAAADDPFSDNPDEYVYVYPSPFSPRKHGGCFFVFKPKQSGSVKIELFDMNIRKVQTIIDQDGFIGDKKYRVQWNGILDNGRYVSNGLFYYKITTPGMENWGKLMVIK